MNSKLLKLYLDTSVPSFLLATSEPNRQAATQEFFKKIGDKSRYEVFISRMVAQEIEETPDTERRNFLSKVVKSYAVLDVTGECLRLANRS